MVSYSEGFSSIRVLFAPRQWSALVARWILLSMSLVLLFILSGCSNSPSRTDKIQSISQLNDSRYTVGFPQATAAMAVVEQQLPLAKKKYYSTVADGLISLKSGKIDAFAFDRPALDYMKQNNPDVEIFPEILAVGHLAIGAPLKHEELIKQVDTFIKQYRADGTYQKMYDYWMKTSKPQMPIIAEAQNPVGVLKIGTEGMNEPMNFFDANKNVIGFDVEFARRLALFLNMKCEITALPWDSLIMATQSGKVDLMVANLNPTPERKRLMCMSSDYLDNTISLLVQKTRLPGNETENYDATKVTFDDLNGQLVGVLSGAVFDQALAKVAPKAIPQYYTDLGGQIAALKSGKIMGMMADDPVARLIANQHPDLTFIQQMVEDQLYAFAFSKSQTKLCQQFNEYLKELKADKTLERMQSKWMDGDETLKKMPDYPPPGTNGVIRCACPPEIEPFAYLREGVPVGCEIEVLYGFAKKYGYTLECKAIGFDPLIASLASEKIDIGGGCITVTSERKKAMLFSDPYYDGGARVLIRNSSNAYKKPFITGLKESFYRTLIAENRWKMILRGLGMTLLITAVSTVLGTLLGFGLCLVRRGNVAIAVRVSKIFIRVVQGTPMVVTLMVLYYIVFGKIDISAVLVAIFGFSLNLMVYFAEMLRSGMDAVDHGQVEAAAAMGFRRWEVLRFIVLPQAVRHLMPVYKGELVGMLKNTAVVGYIAIEDLTKMSDIIRSRTYEAFFPLILTALLYLLISYLIILVLSRIELKWDPKMRSRKLKGIVEK